MENKTRTFDNNKHYFTISGTGMHVPNTALQGNYGSGAWWVVVLATVLAKAL